MTFLVEKIRDQGLIPSTKVSRMASQVCIPIMPVTTDDVIAGFFYLQRIDQVYN